MRIIAGGRCWRILFGLRGARPNKFVCRIRRFELHPACFKAAFSPALAGRLYIRRWQSTPRKTASNGRRSRKMPSAPARNQMLRARGGFHQRWQGVGHHDFNHFKTNSSQKCSRESGLFCADGGAATARRSRRKADSWRRWKSPGQSTATSVSATQCCSGAGR